MCWSVSSLRLIHSQRARYTSSVARKTSNRCRETEIELAVDFIACVCCAVCAVCALVLRSGHVVSKPLRSVSLRVFIMSRCQLTSMIHWSITHISYCVRLLRRLRSGSAQRSRNQQTAQVRVAPSLHHEPMSADVHDSLINHAHLILRASAVCALVLRSGHVISKPLRSVSLRVFIMSRCQLTSMIHWSITHISYSQHFATQSLIRFILVLIAI